MLFLWLFGLTWGITTVFDVAIVVLIVLTIDTAAVVIMYL